MLDAIIVGAGPVGLFLARRLEQIGWEVKVLEKRLELPSGTRAIGIHAGALECLAKAGLAEPILAHAVQIREARVFWESQLAGSLDISAGPEPYNFVAMNPQPQTMACLAAGLTCLERGVSVTGFEQLADRVRVHSADGDYEARWLIAADGHESDLRRQANIEFPGPQYQDVYVMGDFIDRTSFGTDAAIFLGREGLVESFPLPGQRRRWVVKTASFVPEPTSIEIAAAITTRTGIAVDPDGCSMRSSFRTQGRIATKLRHGRLLLAGDAAHVVSPVGGQGMNLGWINAERLVAALQQGGDMALAEWNAAARTLASKVRRRATFNMWMGRAGGHRWPRRLALAAILNSPLRGTFRQVFTMRRL